MAQYVAERPVIAEKRAEVAEKRAEVAVPAAINPAPLGLCAFALTTFVLSVFNAQLSPSRRSNDPHRRSPVLWRHCSNARRDVGVSCRQHLRWGGLHLLRSLLACRRLLTAKSLDCEPHGLCLLPAGVGHLHRDDVAGRAEDQRGAHHRLRGSVADRRCLNR